MDNANFFDQRRISNPQGVIDDLVKLITAQGLEIRSRGVEIERLGVLLKEANIDPSKPPEPKKRGGRKKKDAIPDVLNELGSTSQDEAVGELSSDAELCDATDLSTNS